MQSNICSLGEIQLVQFQEIFSEYIDMTELQQIFVQMQTSTSMDTFYEKM